MPYFFLFLALFLGSGVNSALASEEPTETKAETPKQSEGTSKDKAPAQAKSPTKNKTTSDPKDTPTDTAKSTPPQNTAAPTTPEGGIPSLPPAPTPCPASPNVATDTPPSNIETFANLRRKPGAAELADGFFIIVEGTLVDEQCVPIASAKVKFWQRDSRGHYAEEYAELSKTNDTESYANSEKPDPHFTYAGTATTDNTGKFTFLTIMPGSPEKTAPSVNIDVVHPRFPEFSSKLFFAHHPKNEQDENLKKLPPDYERALQMRGAPLSDEQSLDGRVYRVRIALTGKARFERF